MHKAYHILKDCTAPSNRYKFALVCIRMQKYSEAEKSLVTKSMNKGEEELQVIGGAAGYYLLGSIIEHQARQREASMYYSKAVEMDPTLWVAFEKLCKLEPQTRPELVFKENHIFMSVLNSNISHKDYYNQPVNSSPFKPCIQSIL